MLHQSFSSQKTMSHYVINFVQNSPIVLRLFAMNSIACLKKKFEQNFLPMFVPFLHVFKIFIKNPPICSTGLETGCKPVLLLMYSGSNNRWIPNNFSIAGGTQIICWTLLHNMVFKFCHFWSNICVRQVLGAIFQPESAYYTESSFRTGLSS